MRSLAKRCVMALAVLAWMAGALPARADQTIVIAGPMSGAQAGNGVAYADGVTLAIADINAKGGVLGQTLRFQLVDDACDQDQAEAAARQAIALQPALIIGHDCSACSIRAAPLYAQAKIIQISPSSTNPRLTEMGLNTVFRMIGRDDRQGLAAAERIAATWPRGRIAVVDDGDVYGKGLADVVREALRRRGVPIALNDQYQPGLQTYAGLVRKLAEAGVQIVYLGGRTLDTAMITHEAAQARLHLTILSGDSLIEPSFWKIAGKSSESAIFTFTFNPLDEPAGRTLQESARKRGVDLDAYKEIGYATVETWAAAVTQAGSFETDKVAAALHAGRFQTSVGPVRFDGKGDIQGKMGEWIWYRWRDGKVEHAPLHH